MTATGAMKQEVGLIAPDLVIQLDYLPEFLATRPGYGGQREENLGFQTRVREAFLGLSRNTDVQWEILDASLDIQILSEAIIDLVLRCMLDNMYIPIKKFQF